MISRLVLCKHLFLFAVIVSATIAQTSDTNCDSAYVNWQHHNGDSSYDMAEITATWPEAQAFCLSVGGKLAEIDSSDENNYLQDMARHKGVKAVWLGATDTFAEGAWMWVSNNKPICEVKDWGERQPNDYDGQDCLVLWRDFNYRWADEDCFSRYHFICEIKDR